MGFFADQSSLIQSTIACIVLSAHQNDAFDDDNEETYKRKNHLAKNILFDDLLPEIEKQN